MKSAKCENCGASAGPGATACAYCGVTFMGAAPGAPTGPAGANPEIVRLLRANQKIEAIKVYRDATKCGLKEAKDAVEAIEATLTRAR
jgi:ribosomal protein L7/L12